jgi:hypothetical protein
MREQTWCYGRHLIAAALFALPIGHAAAWERPHSDGPNSGFADVETAPAERPRTVASIGTFAAGAGPAIAPNGTVYLANQQGQVMSFQPDGTRGWTQQITPGFAIVASPVVDSEGAVYVIGTRTVQNNQVNPPRKIYSSILYKFLPSGLRIWQADFPAEFDGPTVSASPNIWRAQGDEVVMVPMDYPNRVTGGYDTRLVAFAKDGAIIGNVKVKSVVYQAYGDSEYPAWCAIPPMMLGCIFGADFDPSGIPANYDPATKLPEDIVAPRPGAAIFTFEGGGTPFILVSNQFQDLVAFTFSNRQFREIFRVHDESRVLLSPPMVLPDGHTMIMASGNSDGGNVVFAGPNMNAWPKIKGVTSYAAPTRMADGKVAIVGRGRALTILNGKNAERTLPLPGESLVSAAASRTHLFVSTAGSFLTYDPSTWEKLAEISWVGGGQITPAIGPLGHVYGMASNVLFVFPPPVPATAGPLVANPDGPLVADPTPPAATPASKRYSGPSTNAGHRLFACQELDGDNCGKSTNKAVALAFCQQQGFTEVDKVDTETRKVKAARLDGQFCTKNKCKVFDEIVCRK